MTGDLLDALHRVAPDSTADELADALWLTNELCRRLPPPNPPDAPDAVSPPDRPGTPREPPTPPPPAADRTPEIEDDSPGDPALRTRGRQPIPEDGARAAPRSSGAQDGTSNPEQAAEWHLPVQGRVLEPPGWIPARSPRADPLPATLATGRALRPLHRRVASRTACTVDEEATARLAVEQDLWLPVQQPTPARWLDLVLVVDTSVSMSIWRHQLAGLQTLLSQLGTFRDTRTFYFDGDATGRPLVLRSEAAGASHAPGELVDPTHRRAVLVVSDCVGQAWDGTALTDALRAWGSSGPLAVIQPLPQRMWSGTRADLLPVGLRTTRRGTANLDLEVVPPGPARDDAGNPAWPDGAVPVPVLELRPRWLQPWARLVADPGPDPMPFTVMSIGVPRAVTTVPDDQPATPREQAPAHARDLLAAFRSVASTDALSLTQWLAAAPLTLQVMQLVQQATMPSSPPSVLAEVFLSGLLEQRPVSPGGRDTRPDPAEDEYNFVPGVRALLLDGLPRHDQLAVLNTVSAFIAQRLGSPNDFPAFLTGSKETSDVMAADQPFAQVTLQVLSGLGGRYGEMADWLKREADQALLRDRRQDRGDEGMTTEPRAVHPEAPVPQDVLDGEPSSGTRLRQKAGRPPATAPRVFGAVPFRNPHFTGRVELIERLHAMLRSGATQTALLPHALHGLGGVGKTQLAIEYAWRYAGEYDLVWWLRAESPTTIRSGLVELAGAIGVPGADTSKQILNVIDTLQRRETYPRWLLVFDNADDPNDLHPYLPAFGHVLITSRNPAWADVAEELQVDVFDREESITLLQRRGSGISAVDADKLAARLGDLPLALDQAAAWQSATGTPVPELDRLLSERLAQLMSEPPANYPASLMVTWDLAFSELSERSPGAARLLELLAYFGPDPISIGILQEGRNAGLAEPLNRVLGDEIQLRRAIREIGRYALAKPNAGKDEIEIHRLVQAVLRERLTPQEQEATRDAVHRVVGAANPGYPDFQRTWPRHLELMPHITPSRVVFGHSGTGHRAALDQIRFRQQRGDYDSSARLGGVAVKEWQEKLGPDHEVTLIAQRHLANAWWELGRYRDAADLTLRTWERMRAVFGDEHEHTLTTAGSVGRDLRTQGRYAESRTHDEENLARHRRVFGADDPLTIRAMHNLGISLRFLGEATAALDLDQQVLDLATQVLGPDHITTLRSLVNVGRDLADAGRYTEAETLLVEALPRIERLGATHRVTTQANRVLAVVLRRSGSSGAALELAEEIFRTRDSVLPAGNEALLAVTVTYANASLSVGRTAQAQSLAERAWQAYQEEFGADHPLTRAAALDLAVVLRAAGDPQRALDLDAECLASLRASVGEDHPFTLVAMINLAHDHALANDFARARELSGEAYERSRRSRGDLRPETLTCGINHALDLKATGDQARGDELLGQVQATLRSTYGADHPAVQAAMRGERAEADIEPWEL